MQWTEILALTLKHKGIDLQINVAEVLDPRKK